ncbi:MAG: hypothetical protein ACXAD7_19245 [Candidatus Kariarchaeaceae archaeon]|jgi:hypothetical protein
MEGSDHGSKHKRDEFDAIIDVPLTTLLKVTIGINIIIMVIFGALSIQSLFIAFDHADPRLDILLIILYFILALSFLGISVMQLRLRKIGRSMGIITLPINLFILYPISLFLVPIQLYTLVFHQPTGNCFEFVEE